MALLTAAQLAPSGRNRQPWRFVLVESDEMREKVAAVCHNQQWMRTAPLLIACVSDEKAWDPDTRDAPLFVDEESPYKSTKEIIRDTAIAAEHIVLAAQGMGLSTCWVCWYTQKELREVLKVPDDHFITCVIVVGYGDENPPERPRKPLEELFYHETFGHKK